MAITLHQAGYKYAQAIIHKGLEIEHKSHWSAYKPDRDAEARYLDTHSLQEYGNWFLGVDTDAKKDSKNQFCYPFGDFNVLHVSALTAVAQEAGNNHPDIKRAAEELLAMIRKA